MASIGDTIGEGGGETCCELCFYCRWHMQLCQSSGRVSGRAAAPRQAAGSSPEPPQPATLRAPAGPGRWGEEFIDTGYGTHDGAGNAKMEQAKSEGTGAACSFTPPLPLPPPHSHPPCGLSPHPLAPPHPHPPCTQRCGVSLHPPFPSPHLTPTHPAPQGLTPAPARSRPASAAGKLAMTQCQAWP